MEIGNGVLYCGGPVTDEDQRRAQPWSLDDEIRLASTGWVALMPDECKDEELRGLDRLLPEA
jgi:hypothetical protein